MQPGMGKLPLPPNVLSRSYEDDVQQLLARAAVVVTDYSSVAFDAAFANRPVVYYQFDQGLVVPGGHLGVAGYFSYPRDGFGPVATDLDQALKGVREAIDYGPEPAPEYQARIAATFPNRDAGACERVAQAIRALGK
jgi:CDP-glycerol glycerophosphotransferase (TagB/SpsB family)